MNILWRAVFFRSESIDVLLNNEAWFVYFVDAPDRETVQAKLQVLLPAILDVPPHALDIFYPRSEHELRRLAILPDAPHDACLFERDYRQGKPGYLTAQEVLFWVSSPPLQQRLVSALNYVSQEAGNA
jgi:hypothetical protein